MSSKKLGKLDSLPPKLKNLLAKLKDKLLTKLQGVKPMSAFRMRLKGIVRKAKGLPRPPAPIRAPSIPGNSKGLRPLPAVPPGLPASQGQDLPPLASQPLEQQAQPGQEAVPEEET